MSKGVSDILLLGDNRLYEICQPIYRSENILLTEIITELHNVLIEFRAKYGFGRAIAAPQLGYLKRVIYMNIQNKPTVFINPEITFKSPEKFEVWDDCMSFPNLLVRLHRHKSIRIKFWDESWQEQELFLEDDLSELLQHEYDHLDGILCPMRAIDSKSFKWRTFENQ